MAIDKALLDQLLAGRERQDLFAKGGLIDDLKKALSEHMAWPPWRPLRRGHGAENTRPSRKPGADIGIR